MTQPSKQLLSYLVDDIVFIARHLQDLNSDNYEELRKMLKERTPEGHHPIELSFDPLYVRIIAARVSKKA